MNQPKSKQSATIDSIDNEGNGLRLEFGWFGDRFGHQIFGVQADQPVPLIRSVEGEVDELWPDSPPLQEFNDPYILSDFNQGQVRLAIGAAGNAHWAVSIEVPDDPNLSAPTLVFDVACRVKQAPKWLGSTYDLMAVDQISCGAMKVDFESTVGKYQLRAIGKQENLALEDCLLHVADDQITLACDTSDELSKPGTLRWRYNVVRLGH